MHCYDSRATALPEEKGSLAIFGNTTLRQIRSMMSAPIHPPIAAQITTKFSSFMTNRAT